MNNDRSQSTPAARGAVGSAVAVLRRHMPNRPRVAVIAGSGLSSLSERLDAPVIVPYRDIPGWPDSTVAGHSGELAIGQLGGQTVAVCRGRTHLYEGYSPAEVTFGVRVLRAIGAEVLIATNAAGALNPAYGPGDVMVITDHLFLPGFFGASPLVGPNDDSLGPRFPGMLDAYSPDLRGRAVAAARGVGLTAHEGVYVMVSGPSYETPAEARYLRMAGGDAVGMSTAPEVVVARHAGMDVLGLSLIANTVPLELPAATRAADADLHAEVTAAGAAAAAALAEVIETIARGLG